MIVAVTVTQPIAGAHRAFTQQQPRALEILRSVVGMHPLHERPGCAVGEGPAEQWQQAVAEKHRVQRTVDIALYVNHRRRAGDQIVQACMGGDGALFLVLDVADVEHEPHQTTVFPRAKSLALQAIPGGCGRTVGAIQAHAQQQGSASLLQVLQADAQLFAVGGIHLIEPVLHG
ncbi:hypothetical protein D3C75_632950 [compost metagenome]